MRTETAIVVNAGDSVGPVRLRLQTAASAKLPVVVVSAEPAYHVFSVAGLSTALSGQPAGIGLTDALDLGGREPVPPVGLRDVGGASVGTPVVENGRVLGVLAPESVELAELSEDDFARATRAGSAQPSAKTSAGAGAEPADEAEDGGIAPKRGLWKRMTRSAE